MKRLLITLLTLLLTALLPTACVYDYDPGVEGSQQQFLVVEGDILAGDITMIQLSRMSPLSSGEKAQFLTSVAEMYVESEDGTRYNAALDRKELDNPCFLIDTRTLDLNQRCRLVISFRGWMLDPNLSGGPDYWKEITYASAWQEILQSESVLDSLTYVVAPDRSQLDIRVHTHGKSEGFYRWIGREIWEYTAMYRAVSYYDPVLDNIFPYENGENYYYCWKRDIFRDVTVASMEALGVDHLTDYTIFSTTDRADNRFALLYSLELSQIRISREAYNYWTSMRNNTGDVGGLFSPQPSDVRGNIQNLADESEYVVGYISAATTSRAQKYYRNLTGHFGLGEPVYETKLILKRTQWSYYYGLGYLPIVVYIPETEDPPEDLYGMYEWATKPCIDCRLQGGSKRVPEGWPNTDK